MADYSPGEVTLTYAEGEFEPAVLLERLEEVELLSPLGRDEPPYPRAFLREGRLLTLGFDGQGGRQFLIRWSFYRHGWCDTTNSSTAHYFVPRVWIYDDDPHQGELLVALCGHANMCFRFPFKMKGDCSPCSHCEKQAQQWAASGNLKKRKERRFERFLKSI